MNKDLAKTIEKSKDNDDSPSIATKLEELLETLQKLIIEILSKIITSQHIPKSILRGELVGIHKSGDEYLLSNYRPITLLSCLYKIIASIMATRVSDLCEEASLFTEINYGFRKSKSALSKVAQLDNVIHHAKRNKNPLFIFSSDIKNAFPTMPPSAVETTLKSVGFDDKTTAFLVNLQLNMRGTARTPFGGKTDSHQWWKSEFLGDTTGEDYSFISEAGIAQGSPLSPLLFILVFDTFKIMWDREFN